MKKKIYRSMAAVLAAGMCLLSACSKSGFGIVIMDEKNAAVSAENAGKDETSMTGLLEVEEGEMLVVTSELDKGSLELGFVLTEEEEDIDELPDVDAEALLTVVVSGSETQKYDIPAGAYRLKAVVTEKATGTVAVEVVKAG